MKDKGRIFRYEDFRDDIDIMPVDKKLYHINLTLDILEVIFGDVMIAVEARRRYNTGEYDDQV